MDSSSYTGGGLLDRKDLSAEQLDMKDKLFVAGNTAFDEDDLPRALDCFHRASVIDSSDAGIWSLVGLTYANLDFNDEAWRSYKLALVCDPDHLDTLWYAGEFLYNNEDFAMARLLLERYINLEDDQEKLEEANEMLSECRRYTADMSDEVILPGYGDPDELDNDSEESDSDMEGFEVEGQDTEEDDNFDEDEDYDADITDDGEGKFVASLNLDLTSMQSKCTKCSVGLPMDAPYCYNCLAPHIYEVH